MTFLKHEECVKYLLLYNFTTFIFYIFFSLVTTLWIGLLEFKVIVLMIKEQVQKSLKIEQIMNINVITTILARGVFQVFY